MLAVVALFVERAVEWAVDVLFEDRRAGTTVQPESDSLVLNTRGRLLYQVHCLRCHGPEGRGDGSDAATLRPPPGDLATAIGDWPADKVRQSIVAGKRDTAMPAFGETFSERELNALADHVHSFRRKSRNEDLGSDRSALAHRLRRAGFVPESDWRPAPRLTFGDAAGRTTSLDQHRGRLILIAFWGASCGPCLTELPSLERLADRYRDSGLTVLPICVDPADAAEASAVASSRIQHLPVFAVADGSARLNYDVQLLPTTVLIDRAGRLIGSARGSRNWNGPEVQELIEACVAHGSGVGSRQ